MFAQVSSMRCSRGSTLSLRMSGQCRSITVTVVPANPGARIPSKHWRGSLVVLTVWSLRRVFLVRRTRSRGIGRKTSIGYFLRLWTRPQRSASRTPLMSWRYLEPSGVDGAEAGFNLSVAERAVSLGLTCLKRGLDPERRDAVAKRAFSICGGRRYAAAVTDLHYLRAAYQMKIFFKRRPLWAMPWAGIDRSRADRGSWRFGIRCSRTREPRVASLTATILSLRGISTDSYGHRRKRAETLHPSVARI
jgi:hypothetical protein